MVQKVVYSDIESNRTQGEGGALLVNDLKRAVNEMIDGGAGGGGAIPEPTVIEINNTDIFSLTMGDYSVNRTSVWNSLINKPPVDNIKAIIHVRHTTVDENTYEVFRVIKDVTNNEIWVQSRGEGPAIDSGWVKLVKGDDTRLSNSREWIADIISQAEAETGIATTPRKWTAQRVRQAITAWWAGSAEKTKLDGIATGATKNDTDANLKNRANHTGTQAISTVSGLQSALDGKEAAFTKNTAFNKNFGTVAGTVTEGNDARLSNAREWTASEVSQAEAETGTATTARKWTALRVRQAIAAWWNTVGTAFGKSLLGATDAANARTLMGAGTSSLVIGTSASQAAAGNHTHGEATTSASGFMSIADKTKLDGIAAGATSNTVVQTTGSSTTSIMSQKAVTDSLLGVGQTWQDVTASRELNTNYTNSTGKPICVSYKGGGATLASAAYQIYVGGVSVVDAWYFYPADAVGIFGSVVLVVVPVGATYRIEQVNSTVKGTWKELR